MLCATPPGAAAMPPMQRTHAQWPTLAQHHATHASHIMHAAVKEEPLEACAEPAGCGREQGSGFLSEGFHSASPSSSSKDSHSRGHSPRSDAGSSPPYFPPPADLGLQLHFRAGAARPPALLTPPLAPERLSPGYAPRHASTPLAASPHCSPARDADSGYQASRHVKCELGAPPGVGPCDETDARDGSDAECDEEPGLRVPAVNSHGKVKTFKCKQCEFVAVTKLSFWEHTKEHIKPEKMLTCPRCPFVTEYKHHLEYHMRNHFGSKPFQCGQCSYSCVNKSMLNSHLKSHSNVYQYRCADCNYATKYCHSLKLHLRKYRHAPAMVLNQDGTPNPLPIIDVYGTRRGPKQKLSKQVEESVPAPQPHHHPIFRNPFGVNFPYGPLLPNPFLFPPNNNYEKPSPPEPAALLQQRLVYPRALPAAPPRSPRDPSPPRSPVRSPARSPPSPPVRSPSPPPLAPPQTPPRAASAGAPEDALDLTSGGKQPEPGTPPPERGTPLTPTAMKNRRKGRAFKLQPAALRLQHEDAAPFAVDSDSESDAPAPAPAPALYHCHFCDIAFKDLTMHTIHMGFHGYNDPFMCNKCGERSSDKISFFIHLGRAEHA